MARCLTTPPVAAEDHMRACGTPRRCTRHTEFLLLCALAGAALGRLAGLELCSAGPTGLLGLAGQCQSEWVLGFAEAHSDEAPLPFKSCQHGGHKRQHGSCSLAAAAADARLAFLQCDGAVARWLGGRHWFALKQFGHGLRRQWWNLDSTLLAPQLVASSCAGAAADSLSGVAETREGAVTASRGCSGSAVDGQEDAEAAPSTDMAALRKFLAQQVVDRDAKVFCVTDPQPGLQPVPHDAAA